MSAIISECGHYRYRLDREIYPFKPAVAVIMVNPSTADATTNDATIRKLLGFGERRGWGRLIVGNLFAWRSKDVHDLANAADPIGPENDAHLRQIFLEADCVIAAWGPSAKVHKPQRSRCCAGRARFWHMGRASIGWANRLRRASRAIR